MVVLSVFVRAVPLRGHAALRALADRRRLNGESGSWEITGRRVPGAAVACPSRQGYFKITNCDYSYAR